MRDDEIPCSQCGGGPATEMTDTIQPMCGDCWEVTLRKASLDETERIRQIQEVAAAMSVVAKAIVDDAWRAGFEAARQQALAATREIRWHGAAAAAAVTGIQERISKLKAEVPQ